MDQETLVDIQIEDGRAFIVELLRQGNDINVAFWAKTPEDESWLLYLGSEKLGSMTAGDVFVEVYNALGTICGFTRSLSDMSISYDSIKYAPQPVAADAIKIRDRYPANLPTRLKRMRLGNMDVEEAHIYPRTVGPLSRAEVVQTVAALMSRTGAYNPTSITLRDGSLILAVPTSIHLGVPGELRIVLHDMVGNVDRSISADEVVSIH